MCACMCVCILLHNPLSQVHVGAEIYCRMGTMAAYKELLPKWRSIGPMGTEGVEGATPDADEPETWGWTLPDSTLQLAAAQVHLLWP